MAALIASGVSSAAGIAPTAFRVVMPALNWQTALQAGLLGAACAVVTRGFCWVLHETKHLLAHWLPNLYFRAAAGGLAVAALSWLLGGRYCGAGMNVIAQAVEQGQALPWDFVCKALLTALTLGAGFKGGEVVPSFFVGACFGCIAGPLLGLPAGAAAAVGLVSVFCGATNTPAASSCWRWSCLAARAQPFAPLDVCSASGSPAAMAFMRRSSSPGLSWGNERCDSGTNPQSRLALDSSPEGETLGRKGNSRPYRSTKKEL